MSERCVRTALSGTNFFCPGHRNIIVATASIQNSFDTESAESARRSGAGRAYEPVKAVCLRIGCAMPDAAKRSIVPSGVKA